MKKTFKNRFVKGLLRWNSVENHRQMPWKGEKNPYRIWLSEIILQQTRVEQGLDYYLKFIKHYPTVEILAQASDNDVFKHWEGLGYYSRCRNLLFTARFIWTELNGEFPDNYTSILQLKGIGNYTAAAIASFAFNEPKAVVDGNVYRVLSRYFNINKPIDTTEGKKLFAALAEELLPEKDHAIYNQAIMDFGATVCKPKPICSLCPLQVNCLAYLDGVQLSLPVKIKKLNKITRYFQFVMVTDGISVLVKKRMEKDIWHGLHQFVQSESSTAITTEEFTRSKYFKEQGFMKHQLLHSSNARQQLTHQTIEALFVHLQCDTLPKLNDYRDVPIYRLKELAFPKLLQTEILHFTSV